MKKNKKRTSYKTVECKNLCGNKVRIAEESISGTCWRCVQDDLYSYEKKVKDSENH